MRMMGMAVGLAICFCGFVRAEETEDSARFINQVEAITQVEFVKTISQDEKVLQFIFRNLQVTVEPISGSTQGGPKGDAKTDSRVFSVLLPHPPQKQETKLRVVLHGVVDTDPMVNARLIVASGKQTEVIPIAKKDAPAKKKEKPSRGENSDPSPSSFSDFEYELAITPDQSKTKAGTLVTFILQIDRWSDVPGQGGGTLTVDAVEILFP